MHDEFEKEEFLLEGDGVEEETEEETAEDEEETAEPLGLEEEDE